MVDWTHKVFVIDMLPPNLCQYIRDLCNATTTPSQWRTLYTHTKHDCPSREIPGVRPLLSVVSHNVRRVLAEVLRTGDVHNLYERSWREPHLLKYEKLPGETYVIQSFILNLFPFSTNPFILLEALKLASACITTGPTLLGLSC